jgi:hypothetical protein
MSLEVLGSVIVDNGVHSPKVLGISIVLGVWRTIVMSAKLQS